MSQQLIDSYQRKTWKAGDKLLASDITLMSATLDSTENAVVDIQSTTLPTIQADYKAADNSIVEKFDNKIGTLPENTDVVNYVKKQVADLVDSAPETLDTLKEVAEAILVNKNAITALDSLVTKNRESIDANTTKLGTTADKLDKLESVTPAYKQFQYTGSDGETINRKTIQLNNFDTISGITTTGLGVNLAMVSKWDVADFGSAQIHMNLNSKNNEVTINDTLRVATDADLDGKVSKDTFNNTVATLAVAKDVDQRFATIEKTVTDNYESSNQSIQETSKILTAGYKQADTELKSDITAETDKKIEAVKTIADAAAVKSDVDSQFEQVDQTLQTKANKTDVDQQVQTLTEKFDDYYTADQINNKMVSVYKAAGNVAKYEDLAKLENVINGNVYNVLADEKNYVALIDDKGNVTWDDLGGIVDLSEYQTSDEIKSIYQTIAQAKSDYEKLNQAKVDKIEGKGLSTEDFTSELKQKLENIEQNANNYTLPTATSIKLGGVKIGDGIDIDSDTGVISANKKFIVDQTTDHFETVEKLIDDANAKIDQNDEKQTQNLADQKTELTKIIDTKADTVDLDNYVLTETLTEQLTPYAKVDDVNQKLNAKLDATVIDDYALSSSVFTKDEVKTALSKKLDIETANTKFEDLTNEYKAADQTLSSNFDKKIEAVKTIADAAAVKADVDSQVETLIEKIDTKADSVQVSKDIATVTDKFNDYYTSEQVDNKLVTVYKAAGNVDSYDDLETIENVVNGNVYNVRSSGKNYVAIVAEDGAVTWDDLGGFVDLSDYALKQSVANTYKTIKSAQEDFDLLDQEKVDKVEGKQLSTEDFTSELKSKLQLIEDGANNYTLPEATSQTLGGVKIGNGIDIESGKISVNSQFVKDQVQDEIDAINTTIKTNKSELETAISKKADATTLVDYETTESVDQKLANKLDKSIIDQYSKTVDIDTKLEKKLDSAEISKYQLIEDNTEKLATKLDKTAIDDYYTKSEVDGKLESKADKSQLDDYAKSESVYSKKEVDTKFVDYTTTEDLQSKLDEKADQSTLDQTKSDLTTAINEKVGNETFVVELAKKINTEDVNSKFDTVNDSIATSKTEVLNTLEQTYSTKNQTNDAVADIPFLLAQIAQLQERIKQLETPSQEQVEIDEDNYVIEKADQDIEIPASLVTDSTAKVTAKSVDADQVTMENSNLIVKATNNVSIKNITTTGELKKSVSNAGLSINNSGYVKIDGADWQQSGYNAIEVGLSTPPKAVDIDNVNVTGKLSNNAISVFDWQPNAVINIRNCSFDQVSNMIRISNKSNYPATFNLINCTVKQWETNPEYSGLIILQDYTSKNEEQAKKDNQFGKIKINLINVTGPDGRMIGDTAEFKKNHWFYTYYDNATDMKVTDDMLPTINGK